MSSTYTFGAVGAAGVAEGSYGYLQSFEKKSGGTTVTRKDASGNTVLVKATDHVSDVTAEYVFDSGTTAPQYGDILTVGTDAYLVEEATKKESNENWTTLSLTLKRWVSGAVPVTTTTTTTTAD
jgi:hypothetical protein